MSTHSTGTSLFRSALLIESSFNIVGGLTMLLYPTQVLSSMTYAPPTFSTTPAATITPLSAQLVQWLGGLVLALTTPLLLSCPNTAAGVASRYTTYWTLGMGEVCLLGVMAMQWVQGSSVFTGRVLAGSAGVLGVTLAWRVYAIILRPELAGRVEGAGERKRQ